MYTCVARYKGTEQWNNVTNYHFPFGGDRGIMEFLMEKMEQKYPNIEYKLLEVRQ